MLQLDEEDDDDEDDAALAGPPSWAPLSSISEASLKVLSKTRKVKKITEI